MSQIRNAKPSPDKPFEIPRHLRQTTFKYRVLSFKEMLQSEIGCGFVRHPYKPKRILASTSKFYGLMLILHGQGALKTNDGQLFHVKAGDVIQVSNPARHILIPSKRDYWLEASLSLDEELAYRLFWLNDMDPHETVFTCGLNMSLIRQFELVYNNLNQKGRASAQNALLEIQRLMFMLYSEGHAQTYKSKDRQQLEEACHMLEDQTYAHLDLDQIAQAIGIHPRKMRYLFKKHLDESPGQYRLKRKMAAATAMLMHEHKSIAQISQTLGYSDPFTFSRQFKIYHGTSPTKFRQ